MIKVVASSKNEAVLTEIIEEKNNNKNQTAVDGLNIMSDRHRALSPDLVQKDIVHQIKALYNDFASKFIKDKAFQSDYYQTSIVTDLKGRKSLINASTNSAIKN